LVRSSFGYHIIRRPPLAEVRDSFARGLEDMLGGARDSLYLSDLETRSAVKVVSGAVGAVRQAAQAPDPARKSGRVLVRYRGGAFRVQDFMHWLPALDPRVLPALSTATEQQVVGLLKGLAQRDILLHQADSARVGLSDSDWAMVRAQQDSALSTVEGLLKLTPAIVRDSVTTPDGRSGSTSQSIVVRTHDVAITKLSAPNAASSGQTRQIAVGLNSRRYPETVEVQLLNLQPRIAPDHLHRF